MASTSLPWRPGYGSLLPRERKMWVSVHDPVPVDCASTSAKRRDVVNRTTRLGPYLDIANITIVSRPHKSKRVTFEENRNERREVENIANCMNGTPVF